MIQCPLCDGKMNPGVLKTLFHCDECKICHFFQKSRDDDGIWWEKSDHETVFLDEEEFKRHMKLKVFR